MVDTEKANELKKKEKLLCLLCWLIIVAKLNSTYTDLRPLLRFAMCMGTPSLTRLTKLPQSGCLGY